MAQEFSTEKTPSFWESILGHSYWKQISGAERITGHQLPCFDAGAMQFLVVLAKGDTTVSFTITASEMLASKDVEGILEKKILENSPWAPCQECKKKDKEIQENESLRREGLSILVRICSALEKEFSSQRDVPCLRPE